jgi:hypothetical protein
MERRTRGGVVLPANVSGVRTLAFRCMVCGTEFYDDEQLAWTRHVGRCVGRHEQEIHESAPHNRLPGFLGDVNLDVEYQRYARERPRDWYRDHKIDWPGG